MCNANTLGPTKLPWLLSCPDFLAHMLKHYCETLTKCVVSVGVQVSTLIASFVVRMSNAMCCLNCISAAYTTI